MTQNRKSLLNKIVKKDYNNELEKILENKQFSENVKSTLLSILYKIEAAYKDLETVKKDVETKDEYVYHILNIISNDVQSFEIIKISDKNSKIPKNKTYIIDKDKKTIVAYPIERKILYAIAKIEKNPQIIKDKYPLINDTLSELINVGNNIDMVEPLRDFNGFSWTNIPQEIESIDHNLIYQNLRILMGYKFFDNWIKNKEFIIDYFDLFKEKLEKKYGKENQKRFIELLSKISILLSIKYDNKKQDALEKEQSNVKDQLEKIKDRDEFIKNTTEKKLKISKKIKEIDIILNNKKLLQKEYER